MASSALDDTTVYRGILKRSGKTSPKLSEQEQEYRKHDKRVSEAAAVFLSTETEGSKRARLQYEKAHAQASKKEKKFNTRVRRQKAETHPN